MFLWFIWALSTQISFNQVLGITSQLAHCFGGVICGAGGLPLCVGNRAFFGLFSLRPRTPLPSAAIIVFIGVLLTLITGKLGSLEGFCEGMKSPYNAILSFFGDL